MEMRLTLDDEVSVDKTVQGQGDTALDTMFIGYSVVEVARRQLKTIINDLEVISNMDDANLVYNSMIRGEYYDLPSDRLNVHAGPLTGGSKVLLTGDVTPLQCLALGYASLCVSLTILVGVLPSQCWPLGFGLVVIAHQYSSIPFKVNHRGLGEVVASIATNVLLPLFAALVQPSALSSLSPGSPASFYGSFALLVVPSFFVKVATFLILNVADRRADWLGGKYTLPVLIGDEATGRIIGACYVTAYFSAVLIYCLGLCRLTALVAILSLAPSAMSIAADFNPSVTAWLKGKHTPCRTYDVHGLVRRGLAHSPLIVLIVFAESVVREAVSAGTIAAAAGAPDESGPVVYLSIWLAGTLGLLRSSSLHVRCLPLVPFLYLFFVKPSRPGGTPPKTACPAPSTPTKQAGGVIVAGGGVGGIVLGACLKELGLPFEVLEKSPAGEVESGADLALWPAATKILKELGVGSKTADAKDSASAKGFWQCRTYPVHLVRMAKVEKARRDEKTAGATSAGSSSASEEKSDAGGSIVPSPEEVLTKVDMDAVVEGQQEPFQLVGREALMSSLLPLLGKGDVLQRGIHVIRAEQSLNEGNASATVYVAKGAGPQKTDKSTASGSNNSKGGDGGSPEEQRRCRVLVGADGIHSVCRRAVFAASTAGPEKGTRGVIASSDDAPAPAPRYGGEVCYRGVIDLREGSAAASGGLRRLFEEDEKQRPGSMGVVYGNRIRFSWGFLDSAHETGYWFVKQLTEKGKKNGEGGGECRPEERPGMNWPEPLRTFAKLTSESCSYVHRIQDRPPLARWSCSNITLLGDACHPATPNNGQGACMAIEDAFVLATLLAEHWDEAEGHVEAFYEYERARMDHTAGVQRESYKQMRLGQLTSPVGIWIREFAIRSIPPRVLQKNLRTANVFDVDPWLQRFRAVKAKRASLGK